MPALAMRLVLDDVIPNANSLFEGRFDEKILDDLHKFILYGNHRKNPVRIWRTRNCELNSFPIPIELQFYDKSAGWVNWKDILADKSVVALGEVNLKDEKFFDKTEAAAPGSSMASTSGDEDFMSAVGTLSQH